MGLYSVTYDRAGVFEKKDVKNGQKVLFGISKKIKTLVLSGIGLK